MLKISVPPSIRWVAKLCLRACIEPFLVSAGSPVREPALVFVAQGPVRENLLRQEYSPMYKHTFLNSLFWSQQVLLQGNLR